MMIYLEILKSGMSTSYIEKSKTFFVKRFESENSINVYNTKEYKDFLKLLKEIKQVLGILGFYKESDNIEFYSNYFNSIFTYDNKEIMNLMFDSLIDLFKGIDEKMMKKLESFTSTQIDRLDEAIHTFNENCFYSSVTMCVSTIESLLLNILEKDSVLLDMYNKKHPNTKPMLGILISFFINDIDSEGYQELKWLKKHEPLLRLCNQYRIFSVHPKNIKISKRVATAILYLTFEFMMEGINREKLNLLMREVNKEIKVEQDKSE